MSNLFYNIVSILVGSVLVYYGITTIKQKRIGYSILVFLHSILFLSAGIGGFFLPKEYEYITILAMLALCITMGITILLNKKEKTNK